MLGAAWYGQGLRLLDISDARDVEQVGYYRVTGTTTTERQPVVELVGRRVPRRPPRGDLVYLFDMSRGVEVLRMKRGVTRPAR